MSHRVRWLATKRTIALDLSRYQHYHSGGFPVAALLSPGFQVTAVHRLGRFFAMADPSTPVGRASVRVGLGLHALLSRAGEMMYGIWIARDAEIGGGLYIGHSGGIIISEVTLGENCNVAPGAVIGQTGRGGAKGRPVLGDRVMLSLGCKVLGRITVGDDVLVGANSVLMSDVPDRAVAVGLPARVVSRRGSFDYLDYAGAADDPKRAASIAQTAGVDPLPAGDHTEGAMLH